MQIKSVAEIVRTEPPYADLQERFEYVDHHHNDNRTNIEPLIQARQPKTVLEVGSWMGYSARYWATRPSVEKVVCVDHWDRNRVENWRPGIHPEKWMDHMYEYFMANCIHQRLDHKICPVRMDSDSGAACLADLGIKFDWIYIDGAHRTDAVRRDIRNYFPLLNPGGVFCGDDWSFAREPENVQLAVMECASQLKQRVRVIGDFWWFENETEASSGSVNNMAVSLQPARCVGSTLGFTLTTGH